MLDLSNLSPKSGSRKARKKVGRGPGSGKGKTCGRGHKGQMSRSGGGKGPWYEGGQMPLYRRLRKRGFRNVNRVEYQPVNLGDISARFAAGETVDAETLKEKRLIRKTRLPVKLLARGEIDKALTVVVQAVSQKARDAVEKAGGEIRVLKPEPTADKPAPETKTGETTVAEKTPPDVPEKPAGESEEQVPEEPTEETRGEGSEESAEASTGEASPESTGETLEEAGDGTEDEESKEISEP
jgi:large subunit ribosomal protein L15